MTVSADTIFIATLRYTNSNLRIKTLTVIGDWNQWTECNDSFLLPIITKRGVQWAISFQGILRFLFRHMKSEAVLFLKGTWLFQRHDSQGFPQGWTLRFGSCLLDHGGTQGACAEPRRGSFRLTASASRVFSLPLDGGETGSRWEEDLECRRKY